nr:hypothetical protein Iba_chr13dCG2480 [Ipomoea batatas]
MGFKNVNEVERICAALTIEVRFWKFKMAPILGMSSSSLEMHKFIGTLSYPFLTYLAFLKIITTIVSYQTREIVLLMEQL